MLLECRLGENRVRLYRLECTDLKEGLSAFLQEHPGIDVVFLGVRSTDLHASMHIIMP